MADNVAITAGSGTSIGADDISSVLYQRVKLIHGVDGTNDGDVASTNGLPTRAVGSGTVSTVNSTAVNLANGVAFTGTSEDLKDYAHICVSVFVDQASATDGLQLQQSSNGTNWDFVDSYSVPASTGKVFYAPVQARYFRLVYTNGGVTTTALRIQTLYFVAAKKGGALRPQDARTNDNDFEEMLGYAMAFNGTTWDRVRSSVKGTQAAFALATQDLKDSGRTQITFSAVAAAAGTTTTETAITLVKSSGTAATSSAVSFVITSGKRFRITSITFATRGHATATIQTTTFNFRINTAGGVTTSSTPILFSARSATPATASAWDRLSVPIPDGLEILGDGTLQIGVTAAATYTTNAPTWDVLIAGYEY